MTIHDHSVVRDFLSRYWFDYDEGNLGRIAALLTDDVHSSSRTDTGMHPHEEFIRSDEHGRNDAIAWMVDHRRNSPYPLRHNMTNIHIVAERDDEIDVAGYLMVTRIMNGRPDLMSTAISRFTLRLTADGYRVAFKETVLDSAESVEFHTSELVRDRMSDWP